MVENGSEQVYSTLLWLLTAITYADITKHGIGYFMKFSYIIPAALLLLKDSSNDALLSRGHLQLSH